VEVLQFLPLFSVNLGMSL